jgi:hypothetical protein
MKACVECGKNLGIIEGYRHPTMGKDNLLCSKCFDTVFESVEKYRGFISPYIGFFDKKSSTIDDMQKIEEHTTKSIRHSHSRVSNLWSRTTTQNVTEDEPPVHQPHLYSG